MFHLAFVCAVVAAVQGLGLHRYEDLSSKCLTGPGCGLGGTQIDGQTFCCPSGFVVWHINNDCTCHDPFQVRFGTRTISPAAKAQLEASLKGIGQSVGNQINQLVASLNNVLSQGISARRDVSAASDCLSGSACSGSVGGISVTNGQVSCCPAGQSMSILSNSIINGQLVNGCKCGLFGGSRQMTPEEQAKLQASLQNIGQTVQNSIDQVMSNLDNLFSNDLFGRK